MDSNLFNNPAFANLSPEKLQFLLSFAQKEKPLNMKDAMPFLLSNMRQAKENHIDFTKPENRYGKSTIASYLLHDRLVIYANATWAYTAVKKPLSYATPMIRLM